MSDTVNQRRWAAFVKKKKATAGLTFSEVMDVVVKILRPVTDAILDKQEFNYNWKCDELTWKK